MAQTYKVSRSSPAAATNTTAYTVPAATTSLVGQITICNTNSTIPDVIRVFMVPSGGAAGVTNAIMFGLVIPPGNPFTANILPTLLTGDFISVFSTNGTSTFTISYLELT